MSWFAVIIFGLVAGAVGFVAFSLAGSQKSGAEKFFLGIPVGVIGLFVGQAAFVAVFHTGVKPILDPVTDSFGTTTGGNLNTGHLAWDIFIGVVGCALVAAPIAAVAVMRSARTTDLQSTGRKSAVGSNS
jgi:uncharacterized membrane protein YeaQ/YmgE (transglycosylase-associated protein family)